MVKKIKSWRKEISSIQHVPLQLQRDVQSDALTQKKKSQIFSTKSNTDLPRTIPAQSIPAAARRRPDAQELPQPDACFDLRRSFFPLDVVVLAGRQGCAYLICVPPHTSHVFDTHDPARSRVTPSRLARLGGASGKSLPCL